MTTEFLPPTGAAARVKFLLELLPVKELTATLLNTPAAPPAELKATVPKVRLPLPSVKIA